MRVLVWTQYFWPENFHINEVVAGLHARGLKVTVVTGKPNYPDGKVFLGYKSKGVEKGYYGDVEVIRLPLRPRRSGSAMNLMLNYLSFIVSGYIFAPIVLRGRSFDLVFVYAPSPLLQALPAIFVSWLKRAPLVLWVQDIWPESLQATGFVQNRGILKSVELLVRYIYKFSDSILIQSEAFRHSVERLVGLRKRITFFPNSAPDTAIKSLTKSNSSLEISKYFSVVFAGNIGIAQSCSTIVEAAALLKDYESIRFFIVGSGSMASSVAEFVNCNNLANVRMVGRVEPEEIPAIYASSSVLLLTLLDNPTLSMTIPSKLQGYLAAGKPVIASCNGQTANVLSESGAGLTCAAEDPQKLADAVLELYCSEPQRLSYMGEKGREYFLANYYFPERISQLVTHFETTLSKVENGNGSS